jgi:hypothetical protein
MGGGVSILWREKAGSIRVEFRARSTVTAHGDERRRINRHDDGFENREYNACFARSSE